MAKKYLDPTGLAYFWAKIKAYVSDSHQIVFDTTANWNAKSTLVSKAGTVYVYTDYEKDSEDNDVPNLKVGDGQTKLNKLPFIDAVNRGVYTVIGTQTEATNAWTGSIDLPELYDGLTIAYYLPYSGTSDNATLELTLSDGSTTGPVFLYYTAASRITTHYAAGSTVILTFWSAGSVSVSGTPIAQDRWTRADYTISNTVGEYAGVCIAGPFGMARYSLILQVDETHWESIVQTSTTATTKVMNTNGFLPTTILDQTGSTLTEGNASANTSTWITYSFDTRYSTNGGQFSAAGRPFYLVGSLTGGKFYLKPTTWWADALPAADDGYVYWYVGLMYSAYQCSLAPVHPMYQWVGGEWREYVNADAVNGHTVNADVPANAVFTDSDTTYTFESGDANGQIKVTPSGGTAQNVSVTGLGSLAYLSSLSKGDVGLGNVDNTADADKPVSTATQTALNGKADASTTYTKSEVDALISAVFTYKGTKATVAEVNALTGMKTGDVWFVTADSSEYAYNGTVWEKLGPTIDLSGYLTSVSVAGQSLTPSSNTITEAQLKTALGLGSAAYTESTDYAASVHTHNYAGSDSAGGAANSVKGTLATNGGYRHLWTSWASTENQRSYHDNLQADPLKGGVKLGSGYIEYNSTLKSLDFRFD